MLQVSAARHLLEERITVDLLHMDGGFKNECEKSPIGTKTRKPLLVCASSDSRTRTQGRRTVDGGAALVDGVRVLELVLLANFADNFLCHSCVEGCGG